MVPTSAACRCARISPVSRCCSWSLPEQRSSTDASSPAPMRATRRRPTPASRPGWRHGRSAGHHGAPADGAGRGGQPGARQGLRVTGGLRPALRRHRRLYDRASGPGADRRLGRVLVARAQLGRGYGNADWLERALHEPLLLAPAADPRTGEQSCSRRRPSRSSASCWRRSTSTASGEPGRELRRPARARVRARRREGHDGPDALDRPERWIGKPYTGSDATSTARRACTRARPSPASSGGCARAPTKPRRWSPPSGSTAAS